MEKNIEILFNDKVIEEASNRYGTTKNGLKLLGNHQNFTFEYIKYGIPYTLRITHSSHRCFDMILAELDWISYLASNGLSVSSPILSKEGRYIEIINIGSEEFYVTSFKKAYGKGIGQFEWNKELLTNVGQATGKMHRLSKSYEPTNINNRYHWYDNGFIVNAHKHLPDNQWKVIEKTNQLINKINDLPKDSNSYGLTHGDLLACNYVVADGNKITLFDFDESCYCWFINDIAIHFFYSCMDCSGNINKAGAISDATNFLEGYYKENNLDPFYLEQLPLFLKLREIILYVSIYRSFNLNKLSPWSQNFMNSRQYRIENDIPFIDSRLI